jgi:hypothetical protein
MTTSFGNSPIYIFFTKKYLKLNNFIKKRGLFNSQFGKLNIEDQSMNLASGEDLMENNIMLGACVETSMI